MTSRTETLLAWVVALLVAGAVILIGTLASAQDPQVHNGCSKGSDDDVSAFLTRRAGAKDIRRLDDRARESATAYFNAMPPESSEEFVYAWTADLQNGGGLLVFGTADEGCRFMPVAPPMWPRVKAVILGTAI
jgi:hypothetical protein